VEDLQKVEGVRVLMPAGTFLRVSRCVRDLPTIGHRLPRPRHVFAGRRTLDELGVACLGGKCFWPGRPRAFCALAAAEPDERLAKQCRFREAVASRRVTSI